MKLDRSELCGNDEIKKGMGFLLSIHRKEEVPTFIFNTFYSISPGYETKISFSKVKYERKTEHLGKCSTNFNLYMTPNASEYVQDVCRVQCITEVVAKVCKCMLPHSAPYRKIFMKKLNMNASDESTLKLCLFEQFKCMNDVYRNLVVGGNHFLQSICQKCPEQCQDEEYKIQMSSSLEKQSKKLKQSFLTVSFGFASMSVETVVESQAFTIRDFFIYVGNNIILYLGMSFVSSFEILDLIVRLLFVGVPTILKICRRKTKVKQIHINPKR